MKSSWKPAILLLLFSSAPGFTQESGKDYIAELDRLSAAIEKPQENFQAVQELIARLPSQWTIRIENQIFHINSGWLKSSLKELNREKSDEARRSILARIAVMKADVQEFQNAPPNISSSRDVLIGILSRPEFRNVRGPNLWDALREKLATFILRILRQIFGRSSFPAISDIYVWMLVGFAFAALAFWIFRTLRQNARLEEVSLAMSAVPVKHWTAWMEEAHASAARCAWREAVHLAYLAALSFLETRGLWHPDRARTPREYLNLLPVSSEYRSPFFAITYRFETIWYGHAEAGSESFAEMRKHLESLGCLLN